MPENSPKPLFREYLLFILLPLILVRFAGHYVADQDAKFKRTAARAGLAGKLGRIVHEGDARNFFSNLGAGFSATLRLEPMTPERILALWKASIASFGVGFDPYCFDASGSMMTPAAVPVKARELVGVVWKVFRGLLRNGNFFLRHEMHALFGNDFEFEVLKVSKGISFPIYGNSGNGLLFWDSLTGDGKDGLLLALWEFPTPDVFLRRVLAARPEPGLLLFGVDPKGVRTIFTSPIGGKEPGTIPIQPDDDGGGAPADAGGGAAPDAGEWIWAWDRLGELRLIAGEPFSSGTQSTIGNAMDAGILAMALLLAWGFFHSGVPAPMRRLPLRVKLTGIFLYLTGTVLVCLAALGFSHFREREEVLVAQANRAGFELLTRIDQGMAEEKSKVLRVFRDFMADPDFRTDPSKMATKGKALEDKSMINWVEVRDLMGELLFTTENVNLTQKIGAVARVMSRRYIDLFLEDRLPPDKRFRIEPAELIIQGILDSPITGWARITNHPDAIHELKFGNHDVWWYWNFFHDSMMKAAVLQGDQKVEGVIYRYLKRIMAERRGLGNRAFRLAAWNLFGNDLITHESPIPAPLIPFLQRVRIAGEPLADRFTWSGEEYLVVGLPGKQLKSHLLAAWYPVSGFNESMEGIRFGLGFGMALALAVALLLGWIFTDAFLTPLRELMRGVEALRARDVTVRVKVDRSDEFGELGASFNRTIEEVGELIFAKTVQDKLIPTVPPVVDGYQLAFANQSAADLGGDFCDILRLPDGRVLFAIGDVTGHGVSSALVMAMAKAVVFSWSKDALGLTELMERLNRLFFRLLRRKKLMTFFVAILDPGSGKIEFSNAGHPQPFLLGPEGPIARLDICRAPLGFTERAPFEVQETVMPKDNSLIFFSDGIVELPIGSGWGVEGLAAFLEQNRHLDATETRDALLKKARELAGADTFPDDITLLIVRRKLSP